jgi:hypothetical protein
LSPRRPPGKPQEPWGREIGEDGEHHEQRDKAADFHGAPVGWGYANRSPAASDSPPDTEAKIQKPATGGGLEQSSDSASLVD